MKPRGSINIKIIEIPKTTNNSLVNVINDKKYIYH